MNKLIDSKLFSNVVFNVEANGFSVELKQATNVFEGGKAYSVAELLKDSGTFKDRLHWESMTATGLVSEDKLCEAMIVNMKYSKSGFYNSYEWFENLVGVATIKKIKYTYRTISDCSDKFFYAYGYTSAQCQKVWEMFCKWENLQLGKINRTHDYLIETLDIEPLNFHSDYLSKDLLSLPNGDNIHTEFEQLDFYKWLDDNKVDNHHRINTRKDYLVSLGYDKSKHRLTKETLDILKYCLDYHFNKNLKK